MNEGSLRVNDPATEPTPQPVAPPAAPAPLATAPIAPAPIAPYSSSPSTTLPPARRRRGPLDWLLIVGVFVAIGGVAFAVGRATAPAAAAAQGPGGFRNFPGGNFAGGSFAPGSSFVPGGGGLGFGGGRTLEGKITAVNGSTVTLTTANGQTIQVSIGSSTTVRQATAADASDVVVGDNVSVRVDGGFGGGGGPQASGAPSVTAAEITVDR
jgi:hypothetical protein